MANEEQLRILGQGVEAWNEYRKSHRHIKIDLRGANLKRQNLSGADFNKAHIHSTNFTGANLRGANFSCAKCGLQSHRLILLLLISWLLTGLIGAVVAALITAAYGDVGLLTSEPLTVAAVTGAIVAGTAVVVVGGLTADKRFAISVGVATILSTSVGVGGIILAILEEGLARDVKLGIATQKEVAELILATAGLAGLIVLTAAVVGLAAIGGTVKVRIKEGVEVVVGLSLVIIVAASVTNTPSLVIAFGMGLVLALIIVIVLNVFFVITFLTTGGTSFRDSDLTEANFRGARLKGTDFRRANLTRVYWYKAKMLARVCPGNNYIKDAQLRKWLTGEKANNNFNHKILRGINLQGANLADASFIGADLSKTNLQYADLSRAKLINTQSDGTNFTGACIEDWNINTETNFEGVICDYVYLKKNQQERRPSDPNRNFKPGEFAKLVQKSVETVDLIFNNGIDWKAFLSSYQDIQVEYGNENVSIQAIENKSDGAFVIRLNVPPGVDKAEIESKAIQSYETKLKVLEAQYRAELQAKNTEINIYKQQSADMMEIVKLQASRTINVEAKAVAESKSQGDSINFENSNVGVGVVKDSATAHVGQVGGTTDKKQSESTTQAIKEIEKLLQELSQENPPKKESEKVALGEDAIERIENDPTWKQRVINAAKEGGLAAFEKALDSTAGAFITGAIKGWLDAEA